MLSSDVFKSNLLDINKIFTRLLLDKNIFQVLYNQLQLQIQKQNYIFSPCILANHLQFHLHHHLLHCLPQIIVLHSVLFQ